MFQRKNGPIAQSGHMESELQQRNTGLPTRRNSFGAFALAVFAVATVALVHNAQAQQPATPPVSQPAPSQPAAEQPAASQAAPAAAAPSQSNTGGPGVDAEHYIIGPEDTLQIAVWKEPSLSGGFPVRPDGMISLVLIGDIPASGRTPMQLAGDITEKLKKYIQDPNVSVMVMAINSHKIYMVGEVGHAGPLPLGAGMSALQALATAGGLSPYANSKKIYILRTENGKQNKIPFNYKKALKGEDQGPELKPGDTIVVP